MRTAPVFDRTDMVIAMPDGSRREIVVYHENDLSTVVATAMDEAEELGGTLELVEERRDVRSR
jgi:hypothetical protein